MASEGVRFAGVLHARGYTPRWDIVREGLHPSLGYCTRGATPLAGILRPFGAKDGENGVLCILPTGRFV